MRIEESLPLSVSPFTTPITGIEKPAASFAYWLSESISDTNHQLLAADNALQQLASGRTENLHQAMITMEEAKLSFQFLEQIRNRLMTAYQDILREQV